MTNKDITKIYFRGNEIVALYQGSTLIFKKSGVVPPKPTGVYTVRGTLKPDSRAQNIQLCVNGQREQFDVNNDKTFEYTFVNVPVTNMDYFTLACKDELKTLDLSDLDTSQVTSMIEAFYQCEVESLNISNLDTSNVTNMSAMFNGCRNLTSLDVSNFDTSKVTNMSSMFFNNHKLTLLDLTNFDTSKVTDMPYMFDECVNLKDLYINFDLKSISDFQAGIFTRCISLTNVVGKFNNYKYNLGLENAPLTAASAMVFINGLATVTEKRRLSLSATTYDSLTTEQIAIATSKGWTVTRS